MLFVYDRVSSTEYQVVDTNTMGRQTLSVAELLNKISNGIYIAGVIWTADANMDACLKKLGRKEYGMFYRHKIKGYSRFTLLVARLKTSNIRYIAGMQNNQFILSDNTLVSNQTLYDMVYNDLEVIGGVDSFDFDKKEIHAGIFLDLDKMKNLYCSGINVRDLKRFEYNSAMPLYDVFSIGYTNADAVVNMDDIEKAVDGSHMIVIKYDDAKFICKNFYKNAVVAEQYTLAQLIRIAECGYPVYGLGIYDNKEGCSLEVSTMLNKAIMYYGCDKIRMTSYGSMLRVMLPNSERRLLFTSDKYAYPDEPFYLSVYGGCIIKTNIFSTQEHVMQNFNRDSTKTEINVLGITDTYNNEKLGYYALILEMKETSEYLTHKGITEKNEKYSHIIYNYRTNEYRQECYQSADKAVKVVAEYGNTLK